jgi:hypothetical protein
MAASTQNSTVGDVQAADLSPAFFEKLPQEIRDTIYDYVFIPEFEYSKVVSRKKWRQREMEARKDKIRCWGLS